MATIYLTDEVHRSHFPFSIFLNTCGAYIIENCKLKTDTESVSLISDEIPPTAMQATMGHLERKSNPKGGTVGDEISLSQNFDRLRMTRRGKADSFATPYARRIYLRFRYPSAI